ncbi:succinate dehydrogenase [Flavobacterium akiainvivens]|uniref:Succinate dehydrogenase n=1 Tax=Flavobacterium akiainvivens TaxID=1202724 RepID=A0A0M8MJA5_9FLAO|nr:succinate dehydrogenase cytochrome b subunit [Flavobacterium akiainvivens]KOS06967.1 succinate dehydrogenase [Flavobacterium akiainvivens]SFQ59882.1 succinate dehydrogenase / fumarate reductase cytochrome b subunit [Flavobacterium akiainvivens]
MAKSALLKSSLAKKYWMALTGLFLCLFLVGHLLGNLQLLSTGEFAALHFNQYALFMTTNPAVKALSYLTYISIIFHAVDGIMLTIQNKKARPVAYVMNKPQKNTIWASRNMAVLGTVILVFIVTHMISFWARMHYDANMPVQTIMLKGQAMYPGQEAQLEPNYVTTTGDYIPVMYKDQGAIEIKNRTEVYAVQNGAKIAELYKDLYKITIEFFKEPTYGLWYTIAYVISMVVLGFHLYHGFGSAFQSLGANNPKYNGLIRKFGYAFAIVVPFLFAVIPVYIHFFLK